MKILFDLFGKCSKNKKIGKWANTFSQPSRFITAIRAVSHHQASLKVSPSMFRAAGSCRPAHTKETHSETQCGRS